MDLKKISDYTMYLIPGYGVYKEFKKPKKSIPAMVGTGVYFALFLSKVFYFGVGVGTNEWHPVQQIKKVFLDSKKESNLEKSVSYEEAMQDSLLKNQTNPHQN